MVDEAHKLGMEVKPWTVDTLDSVKQLIIDYKVDGIITDCECSHASWYSVVSVGAYKNL